MHWDVPACPSASQRGTTTSTGKVGKSPAAAPTGRHHHCPSPSLFRPFVLRTFRMFKATGLGGGIAVAAHTVGRGGREGGGRGAVAAARGERRNVWQPTFWRTDGGREGGRPACGVEDRLGEEGFFQQDDDHVPDKKMSTYGKTHRRSQAWRSQMRLLRKWSSSSKEAMQTSQIKFLKL